MKHILNLADCFSVMMNYLHEGILIIDDENSIIDLNISARRLIGNNGNLQRGQSLLDIVPRGNRKFRDLLLKTSNIRENVYEEKVTFGGSGKRSRLVITIIHAETSEDIPSSYRMILLNDTTKLWKMHREQQELIRQLKKNYTDHLESLKQIADNVAHEVRNPLVSIGGYANLLLRKCEEGTEAVEMKKYLEYIRQDAERLNQLTSMVEEYSDIKDMHLSQVNLDRFMLDLTERMNLVLAGKEVSIQSSIDRVTECMLYMDYNKMNAAFSNLLTFAALNCNAGSGISLSRHFNMYEASIIISFGSEEIREDSLQFMFDPFYSASSATSNFDMAVAQRIIILHGGIIYPTIDGEKVTFRVNIPREKRTREE